MKAIVIRNPNAHSGQTPVEVTALRDAISAQLQEALYLESVDWRDTEHPGHAKELAGEATTNGYNFIFAGGGDGTINEVLNGIMGSKHPRDRCPTLGVLPFGTSNDFFAALKSAEESRKVDPKDNLTMSLDVGHVWFDEVERYFCLTTGIGLFSWANEQYLDASHIFGRRFAHIPAGIATLLSYRFLPNVTISRDKKSSRSRRILSLVVNNSPAIAGGTPLTPNARIDDGQFDVCIIKQVPLLQLIWLAIQYGMHNKVHSQAVELGRIRDISVTARQPMPIHVDGELVPELESKARRMRVEIIPSALRIVIPSLCEISAEPLEAPVATPQT